MGNFIIGFMALIMVIVMAVVISLVLALPVMWCWNYAIVPFGVSAISWLQAWSIVFLVNILLKSNITANKS